ncbi:LGFP repeat-containing protein [Corynebacterium deserti]|nr:LGFP repeat-containing protein [Corynebacterium deserti]
MLLAIGVASPVAQAQVEDQFELVEEITDEQFADDGVDYVPNRNAPTVEEQLEDYETAHPEVVVEYHEQVNDSKDNVEELPLPKRDIVAGDMRSDVIELPEGVSKEKADQLEVAEARLNEGARLMATTGCEVMWPTGFSVCGRILDTYRQVGGQLSWLGLPKSNELTNPDGVGKRSEFFGGAIYWHPDTGAYAVTLDGLRQWGTLNWESGPLGYPTSGPMDTNYPLTQRQTFQGGDNYYNPLTGGAVWGDIKQRYEELGGSNHAIGIPITNELPSGTEYFYNNFSNGTISWRNDRQTRFMYLATQRVWDALGRETGRLGFPEADETPEVSGLFHVVNFAERGVIAWNGILGARELYGDVYSLWLQYQNTDTPLGWPIPSLTSLNESLEQEFTRGVVLGSGDALTWIPDDEERSLEDFLPIGSSGSSSSSQEMTLFSQRAQYVDCKNLPDLDEQRKTENNIEKNGGPIKKEYSSRGFPTEFRFVVRKGHYDRYRNEGWGYLKNYCKHNFANHAMAEAVVDKAVIDYGSSPGTSYYKFEKTVYFLDCRTYTFNKNSGCKEMHAPQWVTIIYNPHTFTGANSNRPKGVISAWCNSTPPGGIEHEPEISQCPDHVNLYNKLRI